MIPKDQLFDGMYVKLNMPEKEGYKRGNDGMICRIWEIPKEAGGYTFYIETPREINGFHDADGRVPYGHGYYVNGSEHWLVCDEPYQKEQGMWI